MKDVLLLPNYNRPEFLEVTLDLISKNKGFEDLYFIFALDVGYKRSLRKVIHRFVSEHNLEYEIVETPNHRYDLGKQSFNLLNGYRIAANKTKEFVFMVEDDVFVSNQFFRWHYAVHEENPNIFCSIATKNNNTGSKDLGWYKYYLIDGDYQSLGVCFRKDVLQNILSFATKHYFEDPIRYCKAKFPNSSINNVHVEQDGLIRRVMEISLAPAAFSYSGLAYHAGFYGYHRGRKIVGTHEEKVKKIREICFSKEKMREASEREEFYRDSIPVELNLTWVEPKLVEVVRSGEWLRVD